VDHVTNLCPLPKYIGDTKTVYSEVLAQGDRSGSLPNRTYIYYLQNIYIISINNLIMPGNM